MAAIASRRSAPAMGGLFLRERRTSGKGREKARHKIAQDLKIAGKKQHRGG
jgi:hypothetical protein